MIECFTVHRDLASKRVCHFHFIPHDDAGSTQFRTILLKFAIAIFKYLFILGENLWKKSCLRPTDHSLVRCFATPIKKAIFFFIVAMKITENTNFPSIFFVELTHSLLQKVNFRVRNTVRVGPSSVQIDAYKRASTITDCNTVRVNHRDQLNDVAREYFLITFRLFGELLDDFGHY